MTNAEQFRTDAKAAGFTTVKYRGVSSARIDKLTKLIDVSACTLVHVTYVWKEAGIYVFPVQPELEYKPAYHVIRYCVTLHDRKGGFLQSMVHCSTKKQAALVESLFAKLGRAMVEEAVHVKKIHKHSVYRMRFFADSDNEVSVYVANLQVAEVLKNAFKMTWSPSTQKRSLKIQKKLPDTSYFKMPAPPLSVCQPF